MYQYSNKSLWNLHTSHKDLQILFRHVIMYFDCTIVFGHRSIDEQLYLYKQGREKIDGVWQITDNSKWRTNLDGKTKMSKHNEYPSHAVDAVPYPTLYSDIDTIRHFAGYVLGVADMLFKYGWIKHRVISGIDWDNDKDLHDQKRFDAGHFEIIL